MMRGRVIRILFDTKDRLPAHVPSIVAADSPSRRTLRILAMEGADIMRHFGLMEFNIAGKPQRIRGSMERIGASGGVDCDGTDLWGPGQKLEMKFQHTHLSTSSKSYHRKTDSDARMSGFRRLTVVLVCEERGGADSLEVLTEPISSPIDQPAVDRLELPSSMGELIGLMPIDLVANVIVR